MASVRLWVYSTRSAIRWADLRWDRPWAMSFVRSFAAGWRWRIGGMLCRVRCSICGLWPGWTNGDTSARARRWPITPVC
jgi:hypothetical protein